MTEIIIHKERKRIILLLFLFSTIGFSTSSNCYSQRTGYDPGRYYSVKELQEDFQFLQKKLEYKHPNLYLYTAKEEMNTFFDSLRNSINKPMTETAFYHLIILLNGKIRDGHTMFLPGDETTQFYNTHERFFPFYITIAGDSIFINMNCSADTSIKAGAYIVSIDEIPAAQILDQLRKRQIRDGYNSTYPDWILTNYFKEYYGFSYGHPANYTIAIQSGNENKRITVTALIKDSIRLNRQSRYANRHTGAREKEGLIMEMDSVSRTGILTIKSFDKKILRSQYKQEFQPTMEKFFKEMEEKDIKNLVLDLRDNQGGDFETGRNLLSYLVPDPVDYLPNSNEYRRIEPGNYHFKGKLYVLINGGSFSNTGIVSSYLELSGRVTFIGEEMAGNKTIISGEPVDLTLPNTKILLEISTRSFMIRNSVNDGHGIIPAYKIIPSLNDIIQNNDPTKAFARELIRRNKE